MEKLTPTAALDDSFQQLLLRICAAGTHCDDAELIALFCREAREAFAVDGVYVWRFDQNGELVAAHADGGMAQDFLARRLQVEDSALASTAVCSRQTMYINDIDPGQYPMAAEFGARSSMAAPLMIGGEPVGAVVFLSGDRDRFTEASASRATILAATLSVALQIAQNLHGSEEHRKRAENLMSLALELSSSLRLPDFVRSFIVRAADMLGARAAALALAQGSTLETVAVHGTSLEKGMMRRLGTALSDLATARPGESVIEGAPAELLGASVATSIGWHDLIVARLVGADNEALGMLCLADRGRALSPTEANLLQAVAGHASVALENSRLFSRIAQSNKHWMEIFDSISDFIVVHDDTHRVLRVNHSLADFIGVRPSELIGVSMRALISMATEAGPQPCPFCRAGMDKEDEYIHPVLERTYLISTSRVRGALNEGMETIHVLKDITDRREAERRYRELFDNIQEGIFFSSPQGRFIEVNDALVRMLGYSSREELLQVDIPHQLYPTPQQRLAFQQQLERHGVLRNFEEALRRKDGSLVHTLQNAVAVRDPHGNIIQYRGVMLDITELKNFQAQLQRERDFNTKILDNTQSMIMVVDTAGLVSYANRRCYLDGGYREEQLIGHALLEFVSPNGRHTLAEAFEASLSGNHVDNLEAPLARGDGRLGHFSVNLSPMRDERGDVSSIVVVMTDITEASVLQAKLMHAEKMAAVGQLVSGVAHEVNNPLTAILGFADLLLEQTDLTESAKKDLRVIVQEAQRTKTIVQNLLSFARQTPAQRKPVDLNAILRRTLQLRSYDFANHGLDVVERLDEELPEVTGDSHQLQQVFLNILNNAYDAVTETDRIGRIEVETSHTADYAEVIFRDNGPGIAHPERIFDPFFTTKEVGKGTGLGLSICYGIIREHGGEISCHNNKEQPGATFSVRLPITGPTARRLTAAGAEA
ncbi:MAG: PAS domain S-box protein [Acidobacteriaceae bacterium]|nr:PAS domain S-box protein [Acidobacteriaceae bacterium]